MFRVGLETEDPARVFTLQLISTIGSNVSGEPLVGLVAITLDIAGLVNPELLNGHRVVMVGVKLKSMDLVHKGEEFSRLKGVVSVSVVTGRFDLILVVMLKPGFDLLEFYTEEVSKLSDVQSVETFVVYKSYNLKVPYVLDDDD